MQSKRRRKGDYLTTHGEPILEVRSHQAQRPVFEEFESYRLPFQSEFRVGEVCHAETEKLIGIGKKVLLKTLLVCRSTFLVTSGESSEGLAKGISAKKVNCIRSKPNKVRMVVGHDEVSAGGKHDGDGTDGVLHGEDGEGRITGDWMADK